MIGVHALPPCPGPRSIPTQSNKAFPCHLHRIQSSGEREWERGREGEVKSCSASQSDFLPPFPTYPLQPTQWCYPTPSNLYPSLLSFPLSFLSFFVSSLFPLSSSSPLCQSSVYSARGVRYLPAPRRMEISNGARKSYFSHYSKHRAQDDGEERKREWTHDSEDGEIAYRIVGEVSWLIGTERE